MKKEIYDSLSLKEKEFANFMIELDRNIRRIADGLETLVNLEDEKL